MLLTRVEWSTISTFETSFDLIHFKPLFKQWEQALEISDHIENQIQQKVLNFGALTDADVKPLLFGYSQSHMALF